jgi:hypothetical protein
MLAWAPERVTEIEAARTARRAASSRGSPSANPTASQAVKQSPAPTVSTGFTFGAGISRLPIRTPRAPCVTTVRRAPAPTVFASCSLGVSVSTRRSNVSPGFGSRLHWITRSVLLLPTTSRRGFECDIDHFLREMEII